MLRSRRVSVVGVLVLLVGTSHSAFAAPPRHTCMGKEATIVGTAGDDVIEGTDGDDVIVGLGGNDRIIASDGTDAGVDLVCGGRGADSIQGRFGVYSGGSGPDSIEAVGTLLGGRGHDDLKAAPVPGAFRDVVIDGGPGNDVIQGSDQNVARLRGGPGDDSITGVESLEEGDVYSDVLDYSRSETAVVVDLEAGEAYGEGSDSFRSLLYGPGDSGEGPLRVIIGSRFDDSILGTGQGDSITGLDGSDRIAGRGGTDWILAGTGRDRVWGGDGSDLISGGRGADRLRGGDGEDVLDSRGAHRGVVIDLRSGKARGWGSDRVAGFENVYGSPHDDRLSGDGRPNELYGGQGKDRLDGRGSDDLGDGGPGADTCVRIERARSC